MTALEPAEAITADAQPRPRQFVSVHDAHCCKKHGCKYGDDDCPVFYGNEQGIECEQCENDKCDPDKQRIAELERALIAAAKREARLEALLEEAQIHLAHVAPGLSAAIAKEGKHG